MLALARVVPDRDSLAALLRTRQRQPFHCEPTGIAAGFGVVHVHHRWSSFSDLGIDITALLSQQPRRRMHSVVENPI